MTHVQESEGRLDMPSLPCADLEQARILAAINHKLFGHAPLHIGPYRVVRQLGAGGMGEVFLARDEELDREVAIKILDSSVDGPELLRSEARALARLSHPNVVQIHELGQQDGRAHVVMEYVPGPTLREWLDGGARSRADILAVFRAAGQGLAAAHRAGIVHRDFKPSNVIVGDDGRVRVLDFGLALMPACAHPDTGEQTVVGTPRYMAPEQLHGEGVDARSDQYAFCVALDEALGGRAAGDRRPRWLWRHIRRGLEDDPARRWPDMDALLDALDPRPRWRRMALAGSVLGIAIAIAFGMRASGDACQVPASTLDATWGPQQRADLYAAFVEIDADFGAGEARLLQAALDEWTASWREARARTCRLRHAGALGEPLAVRGDACLDDQRRRIDALVVALREPDRQTVTQAREIILSLPQPRHCEDSAKLRLEVADPPTGSKSQVVRLREQLATAEANRATGHAQRNFELLATMREQVDALDYDPLRAEFLHEQAATEYMAGSPNAGRERLELARRAAYTAGDDRLVAELALEQSLHAVTEHSNLREAEEKLKLGEDTWKRIGADADANVLVNLAYAAGAVALERGELDVAERELERALERLGAPNTNQRFRAFVLERLANVAEARGELERGLNWRGQAVAASEHDFGPLHRRTAQFRLHHAIALLKAGRAQDSRTQLQQVFERWDAGTPRPASDHAQAWLLMTNLALTEGDTEIATSHAKNTIEVVREQAPEDLETLAEAHYALASIAVAERDFLAAVSHWEQAASSFAAYFGERYPRAVDASIRVGVGLTDLGRFDEAREVLTTVLAGTDEDAFVAFARTMLADLELRDNRPSQALAWLEPLAHELAFDSPTSRLEFELFRALASLRESGEVPTREQLDAALAAADATALGVLAADLDNLAATADERRALGLSP